VTRLTSDEEKQIEMKRRIGKGGWGRGRGRGRGKGRYIGVQEEDGKVVWRWWEVVGGGVRENPTSPPSFHAHISPPSHTSSGSRFRSVRRFSSEV
jgi:hypothetical protein